MKVSGMTRAEFLAMVKTQMKDHLAHTEAKLVIDMACDGLPADRILESYLHAVEWNEEVLIDSLKQVERIIDEMLSDGAASLKG
jgi:hypothetical protein